MNEKLYYGNDIMRMTPESTAQIFVRTVEWAVVSVHVRVYA